MLTGRFYYRVGLFKKVILQVEEARSVYDNNTCRCETVYIWRDATPEDFNEIDINDPQKKVSEAFRLNEVLRGVRRELNTTLEFIDRMIGK